MFITSLKSTLPTNTGTVQPTPGIEIPAKEYSSLLLILFFGMGALFVFCLTYLIFFLIKEKKLKTKIDSITSEALMELSTFLGDETPFIERAAVFPKILMIITLIIFLGFLGLCISVFTTAKQSEGKFDAINRKSIETLSNIFSAAKVSENPIPVVVQSSSMQQNVLPFVKIEPKEIKTNLAANRTTILSQAQEKNTRQNSKFVKLIKLMEKLNINAKETMKWLLNTENKTKMEILLNKATQDVVELLNLGMSQQLDANFVLKAIQICSSAEDFASCKNLFLNYKKFSNVAKIALDDLLLKNNYQFMNLAKLQIYNSPIASEINNLAIAKEIFEVLTQDNLDIFSKTFNSELVKIIVGKEGLLKEMLRNSIDLIKISSWVNQNSINFVLIKDIFDNKFEVFKLIFASNKSADFVNNTTIEKIHFWLKENNPLSMNIDGRLIASCVNYGVSLRKLQQYSDFFPIIASRSLDPAIFCQLINMNISPTAAENAHLITSAISLGIKDLNIIISIVNGEYPKAKIQLVLSTASTLRLNASQLQWIMQNVDLEKLVAVINYPLISFDKLKKYLNNDVQKMKAITGLTFVEIKTLIDSIS